MPFECKYKNVDQSVNAIQSAQTMIPDNRLQYGPTQSSIFNRHKNKSNKTAITMEHQIGPESTPRYARLRTLFVASVARNGTLIHYAEALGHPYIC